jgi:hypothetical protein
VLRPYADLLARPGALAFSAAGFLARLPIAMISLGIVLLLSGTGRSYALAGAVSATQSLVNAFAGPRIARLADRHGQARVLVPAGAAQSAALLGLVAGATSEAPAWTLFAAAVVSGASWLSVGSLVRARWAALVGTAPRELHTAYSLESVLDEVIFVVGPITVTVLATAVHPAAGLLAVVAVLLAGSGALAVQRATGPPRAGAGAGAGGPVLRLRGVWVVVAVFGGLGLLFAALEVTVVAFATDEGHRGAAGPVLAAYALGSMFAGLAYGAVHWRTSADRRFVLAAAAMGVSLVPLPFVPGVWQLAVLSFVAGFAISPTLISGNELVQKLVPAGRLTEGLAWTTTGIALGLTAGAASAGWVVDTRGPAASFWVSTAAALATAAVAAAGARRLRPPVPR